MMGRSCAVKEEGVLERQLVKEERELRKKKRWCDEGER